MNKSGTHPETIGLVTDAINKDEMNNSIKLSPGLSLLLTILPILVFTVKNTVYASGSNIPPSALMTEGKSSEEEMWK